VLVVNPNEASLTPTLQGPDFDSNIHGSELHPGAPPDSKNRGRNPSYHFTDGACDDEDTHLNLELWRFFAITHGNLIALPGIGDGIEHESSSLGEVSSNHKQTQLATESETHVKRKAEEKPNSMISDKKQNVKQLENIKPNSMGLDGTSDEMESDKMVKNIKAASNTAKPRLDSLTGQVFAVDILSSLVLLKLAGRGTHHGQASPETMARSKRSKLLLSAPYVFRIHNNLPCHRSESPVSLLDCTSGAYAGKTP